LGLRTLGKLEKIIDEEMARIGNQSPLGAALGDSEESESISFSIF